MIALSEKQLETTRGILAKRLSGCEVVAFGSRVKGDAKPSSDLDLAIIGMERTDFSSLLRLKDDFAESDLPFRVDVLDWHRTDAGFRTIIRESSETLARIP